jgi:hypothetical protein
MRKLFVLALVPLLFTACGDDNDLTGPSGFPSVAGNYSGTTTIVAPELGESLVCPTTTSVTQSGSSVNIAPLVLGGDCGGQSIPVGPMTIDANGSLGAGSGTYTEPSCGTYDYTASGGFFDRTLQMSIIATSATCFNLNMTINVARP